MSYDIGTEETETHNFTSNMRVFFEHFLGCEVIDLDGTTSAEADRILTVALVRIAQTSSRELMEFDAQNGWGDWHNATEFLRTIRDNCREFPLSIVHASY